MPGAFDARKMASKRIMKISASIGCAPWFGARSLVLLSQKVAGAGAAIHLCDEIHP